MQNQNNNNPDFININMHLNNNPNQPNNDHYSEYNEIVQTTISGKHNHIEDEMSDLNSIAPNNFQKKQSLISSGNLTQVNKIYPTKQNTTQNLQKNLIEDLKSNEAETLIFDDNQNVTESTHSNPDATIGQYMSLKKFEINREDIVFCLSVDGSQHSDLAFETTILELMKPTDKLMVVYIFNSLMDETYNFRNRKDTVIENYNTKVLRLDKSRVLFLKEDKVSKIHPLEQVNRISYNHKCSYLVCGYYGIKGPKGDNKELSKGIDFLLGFSKSPTIIIKENTLRKNKKNNQFNWLFVFDRAYMNCYSIMSKFLPMVKRTDYVFGLSLLPPWINFDDVKKNFLLDLENGKINNFDYEAMEYKSYASALVNEKVNFGDIFYDFVVFYNNPEKHRNEGQFSDIVNIVTKCSSNICFINGA